MDTMATMESMTVLSKGSLAAGKIGKQISIKWTMTCFGCFANPIPVYNMYFNHKTFYYEVVFYRGYELILTRNKLHQNFIKGGKIICLSDNYWWHLSFFSNSHLTRQSEHAKGQKKNSIRWALSCSKIETQQHVVHVDKNSLVASLQCY